jgi:uncharacterized membrane protein YsdA (DUF1294 family)
MGPYLGFGGAALLAAGILSWYINDAVGGGRPYGAWLAAITVVTFLVYGLDKLSAKRQGMARVPQKILHLLALAGGFVGAGLGMFIFRHKTDWRDPKRRWFLPILILSAILHGALIYFGLLGT